MISLDLTLPLPAENLACDEVFLDQAEELDGPPVLRFWESPVYFVVLGYANRFAEEVNVEECRARGIPILRRCSGGGTVLQGPGCLNYSVVLPIDSTPQLQSITGTNHYVMGRTLSAVSRLQGSQMSVQGHTDLVVDDLKFSGNAQRRRRKWLLFHGTILLDFDLPLIGELLLSPPRQPDYRRNRSHFDFVTNLNLARNDVKESFRETWQAVPAVPAPPVERIRALVASRYSDARWNFSR